MLLLATTYALELHGKEFYRNEGIKLLVFAGRFVKGFEEIDVQKVIDVWEVREKMSLIKMFLQRILYELSFSIKWYELLKMARKDWQTTKKKIQNMTKYVQYLVIACCTAWSSWCLSEDILDIAKRR